MALVKDLRTGKTAELVSVHDRAFGLLVDERQVGFYRPLQELEFLTPDPSLSQGGDELVGPAAPLEVISHGTEVDTPRHLTAQVVYWIGELAPLSAIEGDLWLVPSPQQGTAGVLSLFTDGAFGPLVAGGGGGGGGATNLSVINRTATALTVASDTGNDAVLPVADATRAGLLSAAEQVKLAGIAANAEANVNADWTATSGDGEILNKPATFTPSTHAASHGTGGSDAITVAQGQVTGLATALAGKENTGVAAAAVAAHEAAANPHAGVYTPAAHAGAGGAAHADAVASGASGFMSGADKAKLNGIAAAAEVNVNADWTATSGDGEILNKPPLGTAAALDVGTSANRVVQLDGSARLPAVDGSQLTNLPTGGVTDGDKGDITVSASGATWTIDNGAITLAKQANLATQRVIARNTAGAGVPEEVSLSQLLDWGSSTRGSILFRGASGWVALSPGTAGQVLQTGGAGADPSWLTAPGGGTPANLSYAPSTGIVSNSNGTGFTLPLSSSVDPGLMSVANHVLLGTAVQPGENAPSTVFPIVDGGSVVINPDNGALQTWTLAANRTPTATFPEGSSVTIHITAGAFTVTWTSLPVTWLSGSAPVLATSGITPVTLYRIGGTIFGGSPVDVSGLARVIASGTATLGTSAIASGASATVVTVSAPGVLTTDPIIVGFNVNPNTVTGYSAASTTGCLVITAYPTADNINVVVSNPTASSITPDALTLNWRVVR